MISKALLRREKPHVRRNRDEMERLLKVERLEKELHEVKGLNSNLRVALDDGKEAAKEAKQEKNHTLSLLRKMKLRNTKLEQENAIIWSENDDLKVEIARLKEMLSRFSDIPFKDRVYNDLGNRIEDMLEKTMEPRTYNRF